MSKQLAKVQSEEPTELEKAWKTISVGKILKEQDEASTLLVLTGMVDRLVRLYQIPGFVKGQDVELADWIYEKYKFETFDFVHSVLKSPPDIYNEEGQLITNWRLTPDTISKWIVKALDKQIDLRENAAYRQEQETTQIHDLKEQYARMAARSKEAFKTKEQQRELKIRRFSPQKQYNVWHETPTQCDCYELYAIDEEFARKVFKESFQTEPVKVNLATPSTETQP